MKTFIRHDRKRSPFGLTWMQDGRQIRKFFPSEAARREYIRSHQLGIADEAFSAAEWQRWLSLKQACAALNTTPEAAVAAWRSTPHLRNAHPMTLAELVAAFYDSRSDKSDDYRLHLRKALKRELVGALGADRDIASIERRELERWIAACSSHPRTQGNHISYLKSLFNFAVQSERLAVSPAANLQKPKVPKKEPGTLSPEQMRALLEASDENTAALFALQAFAGLRTSSVARLERHEIRLEEKQIVIPAEKFKTETRQLIEGLPENLWPWLERADLKQLCSLSKRQQASLRDRAYILTGIHPPHNALRHSFATYHCALYSSADRASYLMGHTNPGEIWSSYKGIATKADAQKYFAIVPG